MKGCITIRIRPSGSGPARDVECWSFRSGSGSSVCRASGLRAAPLRVWLADAAIVLAERVVERCAQFRDPFFLPARAVSPGDGPLLYRAPRLQSVL